MLLHIRQFPAEEEPKRPLYAAHVLDNLLHLGECQVIDAPFSEERSVDEISFHRLGIETTLSEIHVFIANHVVAQIRLGRHIREFIGSDNLIVILQIEIKIVISDYDIYLINGKYAYTKPNEDVTVPAINISVDVEEKEIHPHYDSQDSEKNHKVTYLESGLT